jgi:hypothetical protein
MELHEGLMNDEYRERIRQALIASHPLLSAAQHDITLCPKSGVYTLKMSWMDGQLDELIPHYGRQIAKILLESDTSNRPHIDQLSAMDGWIVQLFDADDLEQVTLTKLGQWDIAPEAAGDLKFLLHPHWFKFDGPWLELRLVLCAVA